MKKDSNIVGDGCSANPEFANRPLTRIKAISCLCYAKAENLNFLHFLAVDKKTSLRVSLLVPLKALGRKVFFVCYLKAVTFFFAQQAFMRDLQEPVLAGAKVGRGEGGGGAGSPQETGR